MNDREAFTTLDGRQVTIRHITVKDAPLLVDMFHRLSERTLRLRFHAYLGHLPDKRVWEGAIALSDLDPAREVALVALIQEEDGEHAVGVARFSRATPDDEEAEAAVVVRDDFQQAGLGTYLSFKLIHVARSMGIKRFVAWVMPENRQVLHMVKKMGLPFEQNTQMGETQIVVHIDEIDRLQSILN